MSHKVTGQSGEINRLLDLWNEGVMLLARDKKSNLQSDQVTANTEAQ